MQKALSYTYKLFHRLSRYHLDGRYQIDNTQVEDAIRSLTLGRKNYQFCGNNDSAENAAIMYSLLGSCKACDVNPREWLTDVPTRIPEYNANYDLDQADLLPHKWQESKNQELSNLSQQNSKYPWSYSNRSWSIFDFYKTHQTEGLRSKSHSEHYNHY